jgi:hypothetical protein
LAGVILVIILLLLLLGGAGFWPAIPYGYGAGHYGMGGLGFILIILLIAVLMGWF